MKKPMLPPLFFSVRLPTLWAKFWRVRLSGHSNEGRIPPIGSAQLSSPNQSGSNDSPSFIFFRLDALGDVVLTTPLFRELKRAYPGSRCTVVVQKAYKSLLTTNPYIDEVLALPAVTVPWLSHGARRLLAALWFYWGWLRRRTFDYAISPRWDTDEHLATFLCLLTNTRCRVGYSEKASPAKRQINRGFDSAFDICLAPGGSRHEVLRNLAMVEALGGTVANSDLEVRLTERDRRRAMALLANVSRAAKLVAIGIGASSPGRRWHLEGYAETINQLGRWWPVQSVVVCSEREQADAQTMARMLQGKCTIVSGAPLREVCAVLERCDLFVGNDSGCAHLAAAMNCKTMVISRHPLDGDPNHFNSPVRFAPHCAHALVLQPVTGLDDCKRCCHQPGPHCIKSVSVDEAVAAARQMLRETLSSAAPQASDLWPREAFLGLMCSHSPEAIRRAIESLRNGQDQPLTVA